MRLRKSDRHGLEARTGPATGYPPAARAGQQGRKAAHSLQSAVPDPAIGRVLELRWKTMSEPSDMSEPKATSSEPRSQGLVAREKPLRSDPSEARTALSVSANLSGGESLLWIGMPSELVVRGYWAFAAVCMTLLTPLLYLAIEQHRGPLAIAGILVAMAVPPVWAAWKQALVRHTTYELTTERLRVTHGILSLEVDDIELYRVKDIHVRQPLLQRLCGLGSIVIWSSDVTLPRCRIHAQPIGVVRELREQVRLLAEDLRDRKVVRNAT